MGSSNTAQKMKFSIKDFLSKCDKILVQEKIGVNLLYNLHKKTLPGENILFDRLITEKYICPCTTVFGP